jgi:integrase
MTLFLKVHCAANNKPSTAIETERLLRRHFLPTLKDKNVGSIATAEVMEIVDDLLRTPSECAHAFTAAKTFFRFTVRRGYAERSPLDALQKPTKSVARDRVLSDEELRSVLTTARQSGTYGVIVELLVLTGQRVGQITALNSNFLYAGEKSITWPAEYMKGNKEHTIPYGERAAALLMHAPFTFNSFSDAHRTFLQTAKVAHFTRHDLRRTFATGLAKINVPPHVTERILAHSTGTISGVAAIYNRHSYLDEMRQAMEKWEAVLYALAPIG